MEQFYEITPQSKRFAECMTYWNESDKQAEKVRTFMSNHNIPSPALWKGNILYIKKCPDMPDDNFMKKTVERLLRHQEDKFSRQGTESPWSLQSIQTVCAVLL